MKTNNSNSVPILNFLVYTNVFISACAAAQVLVTYFVFKIPFNYNSLSYILFIMLSTYLQYNMQRGYIISQSNHTTTRSQWLTKYKKPMLVSNGISLLAILFLCNNLSWTSIGIMVFAEVVSSLYFLPPINLRKYGYFKPFIISFIWVVSCGLVPLIENKLLTINNSYFLCAQFLFISVLCLLFDIKDCSEDFMGGINTYCNKLGLTFAKSFSVILLVLMVFFTALYSSSLLVLMPQLITALISIYLVLICRENKHPYFFYLLVDGLMLLQGILFVLSYLYF